MDIKAFSQVNLASVQPVSKTQNNSIKIDTKENNYKDYLSSKLPYVAGTIVLAGLGFYEISRRKNLKTIRKNYENALKDSEKFKKEIQEKKEEFNKVKTEFIEALDKLKAEQEKSKNLDAEMKKLLESQNPKASTNIDKAADTAVQKVEEAVVDTKNTVEEAEKVVVDTKKAASGAEKAAPSAEKATQDVEKVVTDTEKATQDAEKIADDAKTATPEANKAAADTEKAADNVEKTVAGEEKAAPENKNIAQDAQKAVVETTDEKPVKLPKKTKQQKIDERMKQLIAENNFENPEIIKKIEKIRKDNKKELSGILERDVQFQQGDLNLINNKIVKEIMADTNRGENRYHQAADILEQSLIKHNIYLGSTTNGGLDNYIKESLTTCIYDEIYKNMSFEEAATRLKYLEKHDLVKEYYSDAVSAGGLHPQDWFKESLKILIEKLEFTTPKNRKIEK